MTAGRVEPGKDAVVTLFVQHQKHGCVLLVLLVYADHETEFESICIERLPAPQIPIRWDVVHL